MTLINYANKSVGYILRFLAKANPKSFSYLYSHYLMLNVNAATQMVEVAKWLENAANTTNPNPKACYNLAILYETFSFVFNKTQPESVDDSLVESYHNPNDKALNSKIIDLLITAANRDHTQAQYKLGKIYWSGSHDVMQDSQLAHDWFTKAARKLHARALANIGIMYFHGDLEQKNYEKAYHFFNAAISVGDHHSLCSLAQMYIAGNYVERDLVKSFNLFKQAAEYVNEAIYHIATCYEKGRGVPQDYGKAATYYKKAAAVGIREAKLKLADYYVNATGVKANPIKAEQLLKSLAESGDTQAQFKLATFYDSTESNMQNYYKAHEWYLKAAQQGHTKAQINLASLYLRGEGTVASESTALFWLENAAVKGDQIARYNLKQLGYTNIQEVLKSLSEERVVH